MGNKLQGKAMGRNNPELADIKNHRIRVEFTDKAGASILCDFTTNEGGQLYADAQVNTPTGWERYGSIENHYRELRYNQEDILKVINSLVPEEKQYTELTISEP